LIGLGPAVLASPFSPWYWHLMTLPYFEDPRILYQGSFKPAGLVFEPVMDVGPFKSARVVNGFSPERFITGLTPAGTFTSDLDIPIGSQPIAEPVCTTVFGWGLQALAWSPVDVLVPMFAPLSEMQAAEEDEEAIMCLPSSHYLPHPPQYVPASPPMSVKQESAGKSEAAAKLLEECQQALAEGRVADAKDLALRAVLLDPEGVTSNPLIYKMHLMMQVLEKGKPGPGGATAECEDRTPPAPKVSVIEQKLSQPISLKFVGTPLRQVLDDIRFWRNLTLVIEEAALQQDEISLDRPVTISLDNVSVKSALGLILKPCGLECVVKDDFVLVTTASQVESRNAGCEDIQTFYIKPTGQDLGKWLKQLLGNVEVEIEIDLTGKGSKR
jgi:hypothetical protein